MILWRLKFIKLKKVLVFILHSTCMTSFFSCLETFKLKNCPRFQTIIILSENLLNYVKKKTSNNDFFFFYRNSTLSGHFHHSQSQSDSFSVKFFPFDPRFCQDGNQPIPTDFFLQDHGFFAFACEFLFNA